MNKFLWVFMFSVFISSCSQIILKIGSKKSYKNKIKEYLNIYVLSGYCILGLATIFAIWSLKGIELKSAPILNSVSYIYILVLSKIFLNEKISKQKIIGNLLIIVGVIVFNL